jgi:hypothetical protein
MITSDFLGDLFRCSSKGGREFDSVSRTKCILIGAAPHNNFVVDAIMALVSLVSTYGVL